MKERPILMSAPMVVAILNGRKTQTRRITKLQPRPPFYIQPMHGTSPDGFRFGDWTHWRECGPDYDGDDLRCPYGQTGDQLWVKETFQAHPIYGSLVYRADWSNDNNPVKNEGWPWKPSIFMPRRSSRITLEITDVRVERLQDISEADAMAEGVEEIIEKQSGHIAWQNYQVKDLATLSARFSYRTLWESINGPGSWDANPWVWALTFRRIDQ